MVAPAKYQWEKYGCSEEKPCALYQTSIKIAGQRETGGLSGLCMEAKHD